MKVAITIWENRISPVFDASRMLMIAEIENTRVIDKKYVPFNPEMPSYLIENLNSMDIDILICGAVSEIPANLIQAGGIKLISFITGYTDDVLAAYAKDATINAAFLMPGCGRNSPGNHHGPGMGKKRRNKGKQGRRNRKQSLSFRGSNILKTQEDPERQGMIAVDTIEAASKPNTTLIEK